MEMPILRISSADSVIFLAVIFSAEEIHSVRVDPEAEEEAADPDQI
jgi:hypothetical protein